MQPSTQNKTCMPWANVTIMMTQCMHCPARPGQPPIMTYHHSPIRAISKDLVSTMARPPLLSEPTKSHWRATTIDTMRRALAAA